MRAERACSSLARMRSRTSGAGSGPRDSRMFWPSKLPWSLAPNQRIASSASSPSTLRSSSMRQT